MGIQNWTADVLLQVVTTGTDGMPIKDKILVLCISASVPPKREAKAVHMGDYDLLNNNEEAIRVYAVYAIVTSTDTENGKRPATVQ